MAPTGPQRGSHRSAEDTLLTPKHARQPPCSSFTITPSSPSSEQPWLLLGANPQQGRGERQREIRQQHFQRRPASSNPAAAQKDEVEREVTAGQKGGKEDNRAGSALPRRLRTGSDLQLGPGGFSTPFLCRRDGSGAAEGASSQAHVSTEPGQGKQTAPEAFVASSEGKSAGNHSWSQGWEGATGPGPGCKSKPGARDMPGPHGPCPASSKLTVASKRPPRHTHTKWLCEQGAGKATPGLPS